jgi:hypothetical protein
MSAAVLSVRAVPSRPIPGGRVPSLPSGTMVEIIFLGCSPASKEASRSLSPGVSMEPGLMAFTRMRRSFKSVVQVRANERTAGFRGAINTIRGQPFAADDGRIQYDRGAIRQQRKRLLYCEEETFHVDVEVRVIELLSYFAERGILCHAGIGEHDIELALLFSNLPEKAIKVGKIRYVSFHSADISSYFLDRCSQLLLPAAP